jgi:hypothetical protein
LYNEQIKKNISLILQPEIHLLLKRYLIVFKVLLFLFIFITAIFGDDSTGYYQYSVDGSFNTTFQSSKYGNNRGSTTTGTFVWDSHFNGMLALKLSKNLIFSNTLNIGYGQVNIKTSDSQSWSEPSINSDYINLSSMISSDYNQNHYFFLNFKYSSSFFDQNNKLFFNPYVLSAASGMTFNINTEKLKLSISSGSVLSYVNTKSLYNNEYDTDSIASIPKQIQTNRYYSGSLEMDAQLNYTINEHLYLDTRMLLSQQFTTTHSKGQSFWHTPDISMTFSLNAPVTSYLNFSYNANFELRPGRRKHFQFDQLLSAGLYFNLKNKAI